MACVNQTSPPGTVINGLKIQPCRGPDKPLWQREFPRAQKLTVCSACYHHYYAGRDHPGDHWNYPSIPQLRPEFRAAIRDVYTFIRMSSPEWTPYPVP